MLLTRRGLWLEVAEDEAAALVDYSAALRADPNFAPTLYARALLRGYRDNKLQGDFKAAIADLDLLIRRFPDNARLHITRGSLLYDNYDYRSALTDYDAALALDPGNVSARLTRANAGVELGDMKGAGEDYDAAIAARPDAAYLLVERTNYHMRIGDAARRLQRYRGGAGDVDEYGRFRKIDEADAREVDKKRKFATIARPKFDAKGNLVITQKASKNVGVYRPTSRKIKYGRTWKPSDTKRFGEEKEQLDEISPVVLGRYIKGREPHLKAAAYNVGAYQAHGKQDWADDALKKMKKYSRGIRQASDRISGTFEVGKDMKVMIPGKGDNDPASGPYAIKKRKIYHGDGDDKEYRTRTSHIRYGSLKEYIIN